MKNNFYFFRRERMKQELEEVRKKATSVEGTAIMSLRVVKRCLLDFKAHSQHHDFETKAEEILFFRVIKPELSSYRIFYMDLFNWWKDRPKDAGSDAQKAYWRDKMEMMDAFLDKHRQFSDYWEMEMIRFCVEMTAPENRAIFHQRDAPGSRGSGGFFDEPQFSDSDDEITARLIAYERLYNFCSRQLEVLSGVNRSPAGSESVSAR